MFRPTWLKFSGIDSKMGCDVHHDACIWRAIMLHVCVTSALHKCYVGNEYSIHSCPGFYLRVRHVADASCVCMSDVFRCPIVLSVASEFILQCILHEYVAYTQSLKQPFHSQHAISHMMQTALNNLSPINPNPQPSNPRAPLPHRTNNHVRALKFPRTPLPMHAFNPPSASDPAPKPPLSQKPLVCAPSLVSRTSRPTGPFLFLARGITPHQSRKLPLRTCASTSK
jgi:hypothetical protein